MANIVNDRLQITEEMIRAGEYVLSVFSVEDYPSFLLVQRIYEAMNAAKPKSEDGFLIQFDPASPQVEIGAFSPPGAAWQFPQEMQSETSMS